MKVVEVWKKAAGLPEGMIYHSFGEIMEVSMENWLARIIKQGGEPEFGIDEAMQSLFGASDDRLRPYQELEWINRYRIPEGLRVVEKYLNHPDQRARILALQTLLDLNPPSLPGQLVEMLHGHIGVSGVSRGDVQEISLILRALRTIGIPPGASRSSLRTFLLTLRESQMEEKRFKNSDLGISSLKGSSKREFDHLIDEEIRKVVSDEAEATYYVLGFTQGKPYLKAELQHPDPDRRRHALELIYAAKFTNFEKGVKNLLEDPDPWVRLTAVGVLRELGSQGVARYISPRLLNDVEVNVRNAAAHALLELKDPSTADAAILSLQNEGENFPGAVYLIELLGVLKDRSSIPFLRNYLNSKSTSLRLEAATALARMGEVESAKETFKEKLFSQKQGGRILALQKLASLPLKEGHQLFRAIREMDPQKFKTLLKEKIPEPFRLWDRFQKGWDHRVQANWNWLRTEVKNGALISPKIKDPHWRHFLKDSLRQKESDLSPGFNLRYQQVLEEAARTVWTQDEARIQLIEILQDDFLDGLKEYGGKPESQDLRANFEMDVARGVNVPHWVRAWLALNPSKRIPLPSLTLTKEELAEIDHPTKGNESLSNSLELYETLAEQIAPLLGLPADFLVQKDDDKVRYSFLPIRFLLEGLDARFGRNAVKLHDMNVVSTLWDMVRMVKERRRPLLITRLIGDIEGRPEVVPFVRALHDIYHLLKMSQLPEEIQTGALSIIEIMEEMGMIQEDDLSLGALLDGLLSDLDPGFEDMFGEMFNYQLKDPILVEIFYEKLKEKTRGHPNHRLILAKFEKIYGAKLGISDWDTLPPSEPSAD
jgi:hypothetical protein